MDIIPFKDQTILDNWQWLILVGFCLILTVAALLAQRFGKRHKNNRLLDVFKPTQGSQLLHQVEFSQRILPGKAKLYYLCIDGKRHLVFETEKGLIELEQDMAGQQSDKSSPPKETVGG